MVFLILLQSFQSFTLFEMFKKITVKENLKKKFFFDPYLIFN